MHQYERKLLMQEHEAVEAEKIQLEMSKSRLTEWALKLKNEKLRLATGKKVQDGRAKDLNDRAKKLEKQRQLLAHDKN